MEKIQLSEFVKNNSQKKAAELIGVHQTAISKAIREKRNILLSFTDKGTQAIEIKPFPSNKK